METPNISIEFFPPKTPEGAEKLRVARYAFSEHEVKQYFPEHKVLAGLFSVVHKLYGISVTARDAETWHPDVRYYQIHKDGALLGGFYLDLYARDGKRPGAWMDDVRGRRVKGGQVQTPVAYLDGLGFLGPGVLAAHAVWVSDAEVAVLKSRGVGVAHNPESNMKLASGTAPVPAYLRAGVALGLGTDGAASRPTTIQVSGSATAACSSPRAIATMKVAVTT